MGERIAKLAGKFAKSKDLDVHQDLEKIRHPIQRLYDRTQKAHVTLGRQEAAVMRQQQKLASDFTKEFPLEKGQSLIVKDKAVYLKGRGADPNPSKLIEFVYKAPQVCLLYTSPSPRD